MLKTGMPWNENDAQNEAKEMYDRMFTMKFLPPGYSDLLPSFIVIRSWIMGYGISIDAIATIICCA